MSIGKHLIKFHFIFFVFLLNAQEETMVWDDESPLVWSDFKARPNPNTDAAAITASGLTFGYSVSETNRRITNFKAEIYAHFYPYKSWVKDGNDTDYILAHERLHFDITELHARKFRKALSSLKVSNNIKERLRQIHDRINRQLDLMQNTYDFESNHSINKEAQLKWEKKVKEELLSLKDYTSPYVSGSR